jgi:hypothetical protein
MKTIIPETISSIEEAEKFLTDLHNNGETYHPEDDAHMIDWETVEVSDQEKDALNNAMIDIYNLPGNDGRHDSSIIFDPCGFLLSLREE